MTYILDDQWAIEPRVITLDQREAPGCVGGLARHGDEQCLRGGHHLRAFLSNDDGRRRRRTQFTAHRTLYKKSDLLPLLVEGTQ